MPARYETEHVVKLFTARVRVPEFNARTRDGSDTGTRKSAVCLLSLGILNMNQRRPKHVLDESEENYTEGFLPAFCLEKKSLELVDVFLFIERF